MYFQGKKSTKTKYGFAYFNQKYIKRAHLIRKLVGAGEGAKKRGDEKNRERKSDGRPLPRFCAPVPFSSSSSSADPSLITTYLEPSASLFFLHNL